MRRNTELIIKNLLFFTYVICLLTSPCFSQKISESTLKKIIRQFKSGGSYNELIEDAEITLPGEIDRIDESQLSDGKNLVVSEPVQDKNINEEEYYIGPGDVFIVYIWGKIEKTFTLSVDSEGRLTIPLVGMIDLNGKTLKETKSLIIDKMQQIYKNKVNISVVLSNIPQFKAYITGEVGIPGSYLVTGMTRVSDLVELSGGIIIDDGKWRGIEIRNDLYETRYADLAVFYHSQDMDKNPYLRRGDRIYVPPRNEFVSINGFVNYDDIYDFCEGDNVKGIISAAGGFSRGADKEKIIINRFVNDYDSLGTYEISYQQAEDFLLEKDDRILVCGIPEYRKHREVTIKGEVKFPGVYPIRKDKTKLVDIIAMAGGLTEDAFLKGSKIIRKYYPEVGEREFERVKTIPVASLTPLERSYLKTKLVEEDGIVSLDFEELLRNGYEVYNIRLRDQDNITIARKSLSIRVSGAVVSPGLISFKENADYKYYIGQAGGFNTKARKNSVMTIKGGTEVMLEPQKVKNLEAGDAIWVPEKEYRDSLQITKDFLLILSSTATVIIAIFTIREFAK